MHWLMDLMPGSDFQWGEPEPGDNFGEHHLNHLRVLYALCKFYEPDSILEFGVRYGYSLKAMHLARPAAQLTGIDNGSYTSFWDIKARARVPAAKLGHRDTRNLSRIEPVDFVHVDAGHRFDECLADLMLVLPRAKVVVVDDYHPANHPGVWYAVEEASRITGCDVIEICEEDSLIGPFKGMAVIDGVPYGS